MKYLSLFVTLLLMAFCGLSAHGQAVNWNGVNPSKHMLLVGAGWDYGASWSLGYQYRPSGSSPLLLHGEFSMPSGEKWLDDFKLKMGGQILLFSTSGFKAGVSINGLYRTFGNPLVRMQNFGAEMKATLGFYQQHWLLAGEVGFDKAIVTSIAHSPAFKDNIYAAVQDGWFQPATGGNLSYGLLTGFSSRKADVLLHIGKVVTQDFSTTPLIPYYAKLAVLGKF